MVKPERETGEVTRRRDEVLQAAIHQAIRAELAECGYAGVTYDGVARRAKTSRSVIYRRYRSRAHMVTDALPSLHWPHEWQSAGSLRQDLIHIFTAILDRFDSVGIDTYRRLGAEADDELFDQTTSLISELISGTIRRALTDARDRGEIGSAPILKPVEMTLLALVRNEVFFTRNPFDEQTLIELIDSVYLPLIDAVSQPARQRRS
ncbi:AcrR family transcriptional regulator [Mycobacterium sp. MAA66]|uniref:TetR/AcrR family transcriptional regulator n=1 Tax=Mycobacterium sp. MAA66 TaxID=3156297 RepID=UPI00351483F9